MRGRIESVFEVKSVMADGSVKEAAAKEEQPSVEFKMFHLHTAVQAHASS